MEILVNRSTQTVCFNSEFLTQEVDLSSMDPMVDVVLYETDTKTGTKYFSENAMVDGYLKPQETIDEVEFNRLVAPIVDLAQKHWDALRYPFEMYKTSATAEQLEDFTYVGQIEYITTYPHPTEPPEGYTTIESPNPFRRDALVQWTGTGWYRAPWKFSDDLAIQKEDFRNHILTQISEKVNNQLRVHSMYDIIENGKSLRPSDSKKHGHLTMESYINELKNRYQLLLELINSAISVDDLFQLNFDVNDLF